MPEQEKMETPLQQPPPWKEILVREQGIGYSYMDMLPGKYLIMTKNFIKLAIKHQKTNVWGLYTLLPSDIGVSC